MHPKEINDPDFIKDHERFHGPAIDKAISVFVKRDWLSEACEVRLRPEFAQRRDYSDQGDIYIWKDGWTPDRKLRTEVKWRQFPFTSASDYPYPSIWVNDAYPYDHMSPIPRFHLIFNQDMTFFALVDRGSYRLWIREPKTVRGLTKDAYLLPVKYADYFPC